MRVLDLSSPAHPVSPVSLRLRRNLSSLIALGHPWVYRDALHNSRGLPTGTVADLLDEQGQFVARGLYDATSPIAFRVFTRDPAEPLDAALVHRRLARAWALRRQLLPSAQGPCAAYRLCHGEGDLLPGVVVDVYGPVAVLLFDGEQSDEQPAPASVFRQDIVRSLFALLKDSGLTAVYERHQRRGGGGGRLLHGELPPPPAGGQPGEVLVIEHGVKLLVDVVNGQKTGMFLDQRENRAYLARLVSGKTVWNGFCYTGGFSVHAACAGAAQVTSVDRASPAIATARRNFLENGLDPSRHVFVTADVFSELRRLFDLGARYDVVLVDPPSFAPSERAVPAALLAYRDLHQLALSIVAKQGLLVASSCSSHVHEPEFLATLSSAAAALGRPLRVLSRHSQPLDHPTLPAFPQGQYLKFIVLAAD